MKKQMCFWHPDRPATHIVNLGSAIDRDMPACEKCAKHVQDGKQTGVNPNATIRPIN